MSRKRLETGVTCPQCASDHVRRNGFSERGQQRYECVGCRIKWSEGNEWRHMAAYRLAKKPPKNIPEELLARRILAAIRQEARRRITAQLREEEAVRRHAAVSI